MYSVLNNNNNNTSNFITFQVWFFKVMNANFMKKNIFKLKYKKIKNLKNKTICSQDINSIAYILSITKRKVSNPCLKKNRLLTETIK